MKIIIGPGWGVAVFVFFWASLVVGTVACCARAYTDGRRRQLARCRKMLARRRDKRRD